MADLTPPIRHVRTKDDTRIELGAQLIRPDGSVVNLAGLTVEFRLIKNSDGTDKVAQTGLNVTIVDAATGKVSYDFQAVDVDTAGVFSAFFIIVTGGDDTFPADGRKYLVEIVDPAAV